MGVNPLIGRTCLVWMAERDTFYHDKRPPLHEPARQAPGIIMDVTPAHKHEKAGDCARDQFDGWRLLVLLDGGELTSAEHQDVTVQ